MTAPGGWPSYPDRRWMRVGRAPSRRYTGDGQGASSKVPLTRMPRLWAVGPAQPGHPTAPAAVSRLHSTLQQPLPLKLGCTYVCTVCIRLRVRYVDDVSLQAGGGGRGSVYGAGRAARAAKVGGGWARIQYSAASRETWRVTQLIGGWPGDGSGGADEEGGEGEPLPARGWLGNPPSESTAPPVLGSGWGQTEWGSRGGGRAAPRRAPAAYRRWLQRKSGGNAGRPQKRGASADNSVADPPSRGGGAPSRRPPLLRRHDQARRVGRGRATPRQRQMRGLYGPGQRVGGEGGAAVWDTAPPSPPCRQCRGPNHGMIPHCPPRGDAALVTGRCVGGCRPSRPQGGQVRRGREGRGSG